MLDLSISRQTFGAVVGVSSIAFHTLVSFGGLTLSASFFVSILEERVSVLTAATTFLGTFETASIAGNAFFVVQIVVSSTLSLFKRSQPKTISLLDHASLI